jgi:hypothetical protein
VLAIVANEQQAGVKRVTGITQLQDEKCISPRFAYTVVYKIKKADAVP